MSVYPARFSLPQALAARDTPDFGKIFKQEVEQLDPTLLPLQQGLTGTSAVADEPISVMVLGASATADGLRVKAGIFYAGLLGGCSCADDPTPMESQPEYCELWFEIDLRNAATRVEPVPQT